MQLTESRFQLKYRGGLGVKCTDSRPIGRFEIQYKLVFYPKQLFRVYTSQIRYIKAIILHNYEYCKGNTTISCSSQPSYIFFLAPLQWDINKRTCSWWIPHSRRLILKSTRRSPNSNGTYNKKTNSRLDKVPNNIQCR